MHKRVIILNNTNISKDDIVIDEEYIFNTLQGQVGADGLSFDTDLQKDIEWIKEIYKNAFKEPDIIDVKKLKETFLYEVERELGKVSNAHIVVIGTIIDELKYFESAFGIVDTGGVVNVLTASDILYDYGNYLRGGFSLIDWEKENLEYKIIDTLDFHV